MPENMVDLWSVAGRVTKPKAYPKEKKRTYEKYLAVLNDVVLDGQASTLYLDRVNEPDRRFEVDGLVWTGPRLSRLVVTDNEVWISTIVLERPLRFQVTADVGDFELGRPAYFAQNKLEVKALLPNGMWRDADGGEPWMVDLRAAFPAPQAYSRAAVLMGWSTLFPTE